MSGTMKERMAWCVLAVGCLCVALAPVSVAEEAAMGEWSKTVALGAALTSGNSETMTLNGTAVAERQTEGGECRIGVEGNYGETEVEVEDADGNTSDDTETTVQNAKAFAIRKWNFDHSYVYSDNSVFHDDIANLDYRLILGAGLGRYLVKSDASTLTAEVGGAWVKEEYAEDGSDDYAAVRLGERFEHQLSETAKCWQSAEYLPKADDWGDYLLNAEVGVEAALNSKMNLRVVAQDRYDSEPPAGTDENDLSVIAAFVYSL